MIHLRVVSPPDVTGALMPMLHSEPAVMNLMMLPGAVTHPDGDAVHFDVLHGAANEVIGRLREPLIKPNENEREGYVPNVVYSCGSLLHGRRLIVPYGMSDYATTFATLSLDEVLAAME